MTLSTIIQYPVGQGGFHFGFIANGDIAYIYDCGDYEKSKISDYIDEVVTKLANTQKVHIFISHLHKDHCNHLEELLRKLNNKKVHLIFPYMTFEEKVLALIKSNPNLQYSDSNLQDNDIKLFLDTKTYFTKKRKNIIFSEMKRDNNIFPEPMFQFPEQDKISDNFVLKSRYSKWILKPYVKPISDKSLTKFKKALQSYPKLKDSIKKASILNSDINDLRKAYEKAFGQYDIKKKKWKTDLNLTSLCLYSGTEHIYFYNNFYNCHRISWMLTGDSSIKTIQEITDFKQHYIEQIAAINFFQIPHHGSNHNSNLASLMITLDYDMQRFFFSTDKASPTKSRMCIGHKVTTDECTKLENSFCPFCY